MLTRLEFAGASCRLHRTLLASGPVRKSEKEACRDERELCKNVLDYVTRRFNASSAVLKKLAGAGPALGPPLYAIARFKWNLESAEARLLLGQSPLPNKDLADTRRFVHCPLLT